MPFSVLVRCLMLCTVFFAAAFFLVCFVMVSTVSSFAVCFVLRSTVRAAVLRTAGIAGTAMMTMCHDRGGEAACQCDGGHYCHK